MIFSRQIFPFSLHLYRFLGLSILLFVTFLSTVPAAIATKRVSVLLCLFAVVLTGMELSASRALLIARQKPLVAEDDASVMKYLEGATSASTDIARERVLFEFSADDENASYPSPHYLTSELRRRTGRETGNGLFIQSSVTQAFLLNAGVQLKLNFYGSPELTSSDERFTAEDHASQLPLFWYLDHRQHATPERRGSVATSRSGE